MADEAANTIDDEDPEAEEERCSFVGHDAVSNSPMNSPNPLPGAPAVGVYRQACSEILLAVRFVGRDRLLWNSMVQKNTKI